MTYRYRIKTLLKEDSAKIDSVLKTKGRFIIATNELDELLLSCEELLLNCTPTMRWIFQLFGGVHFLARKTQDKTEKIILNLNPVRCHVPNILCPPFQKMVAVNEVWNVG